jgi:hypothetical protein
LEDIACELEDKVIEALKQPSSKEYERIGVGIGVAATDQFWAAACDPKTRDLFEEKVYGHESAKKIDFVLITRTL